MMAKMWSMALSPIIAPVTYGRKARNEMRYKPIEIYGQIAPILVEPHTHGTLKLVKYLESGLAK